MDLKNLIDIAHLESAYKRNDQRVICQNPWGKVKMIERKQRDGPDRWRGCQDGGSRLGRLDGGEPMEAKRKKRLHVCFEGYSPTVLQPLVVVA